MMPPRRNRRARSVSVRLESDRDSLLSRVSMGDDVETPVLEHTSRQEAALSVASPNFRPVSGTGNRYTGGSLLLEPISE
jgi:hypothetical protein